MPCTCHCNNCQLEVFGVYSTLFANNEVWCVMWMYSYCSLKCMASVFSGEYSCLRTKMILRREFSYYLLQVRAVHCCYCRIPHPFDVYVPLSTFSSIYLRLCSSSFRGSVFGSTRIRFQLELLSVCYRNHTCLPPHHSLSFPPIICYYCVLFVLLCFWAFTTMQPPLTCSECPCVCLRAIFWSFRCHHLANDDYAKFRHQR